jgi:aminomethyltransferase
MDQDRLDRQWTIVRGPTTVPRTMSESATQPLRRTPIYEEHVALGGRIVPFAGWEMPVQYTGIVDEHTAVRTAAGLFDVSHMGRLQLTGEHALAVVDYLVTNDVKKLVDGQAMYTCCCNAAGTILDDLIIYRAEPGRIIVVCNASNRPKIVAHFAKACEHHCEFKDKSDETGLIALQGPKAFEILGGMGRDAAALSSLKSFHFRDAVVGNAQCTVARTGYTGEDGCEIFCAKEDAAGIWRQLIELGKPLGLKPVGLGARDTLRLEARLSLYGNDIDETTNPIEAGLGWVTKLGKGEFVGREALLAVKNAPLPRTLVGFQVLGRGIARHGYPLRDLDGREIGVCTSGGPGPTVNKNIGLGYVPTGMSAIGTKFHVDCRGKSVEAVVVAVPFYKRSK